MNNSRLIYAAANGQRGFYLFTEPQDPVTRPWSSPHWWTSLIRRPRLRKGWDNPVTTTMAGMKSYLEACARRFMQSTGVYEEQMMKWSLGQKGDPLHNMPTESRNETFMHTLITGIEGISLGGHLQSRTLGRYRIQYTFWGIHRLRPEGESRWE